MPAHYDTIGEEKRSQPSPSLDALSDFDLPDTKYETIDTDLFERDRIGDEFNRLLVMAFQAHHLDLLGHISHGSTVAQDIKFRLPRIEHFGEPPVIFGGYDFNVVDTGVDNDIGWKFAELISRTFESDPEEAFQMLKKALEQYAITRGGATHALLRVLAGASTEVVDEIQEKIVKFGLVDYIYPLAKDLYHTQGSEQWLVIAASALEHAGDEGWRALLDIAKSGDPEAEVFVGTIANTSVVDIGDRADALCELAKNPDGGVCERVLEEAVDFPPQYASKILEALIEHSDAATRDYATEALQTISPGG